MQDFNLMRKNINKKFLRDFYEKKSKKYIDSKKRLVYTKPRELRMNLIKTNEKPQAVQYY